MKNLSNISNLVEGPLLNDNDSETSFLEIPEHFDKDKENGNDTESEKSWDETTTNVNSIESFGKIVDEFFVSIGYFTIFTSNFFFMKQNPNPRKIWKLTQFKYPNPM